MCVKNHCLDLVNNNINRLDSYKMLFLLSMGFHLLNVTLFTAAVYFRVVELTELVPEKLSSLTGGGSGKYLTVWNAVSI